MIKIKKCPFCGCNLLKIDLESDVLFLHDSKECFLGLFSIRECENEKIKSWNTRKPVDDVVEALEKELKLAEEEMERISFKGLPYFDSQEGYAMGIYCALNIVKEILK